MTPAITPADPAQPSPPADPDAARAARRQEASKYLALLLDRLYILRRKGSGLSQTESAHLKEGIDLAVRLTAIAEGVPQAPSRTPRR